MRAVVQRVGEARVEVDGVVAGEIGEGVLVLVGVFAGDTEQDARLLAEKCVNLRVFPDEFGKMNLSLLQTGGAILAISQFTICGDTSKGRRPSFEKAAAPDKARVLYEHFVESCRKLGVKTETGRFQAHMHVYLLNDGPVTLICESRPLK